MKLIYKPFGIILGILAGFLSKKLFDTVWGIFDDEEPPKPTTKETSWPKVLAAAAVQGIVFKTVRAVVDRARRQGLRAPHRLLARSRAGPRRRRRPRSSASRPPREDEARARRARRGRPRRRRSRARAGGRAGGRRGPVARSQRRSTPGPDALGGLLGEREQERQLGLVVEIPADDGERRASSTASSSSSVRPRRSCSSAAAVEARPRRAGSRRRRPRTPSRR